MAIDPTDLELDYRAKNYQDFKSLKRKRITCATCGISLSSKVETPGHVFVHPLMTTLQCKKCSDFYGSGDFSMDEDGDDKYCRMCGNGGELFLCGNKPCPFGFCHKCIKRYVGSDSSEIEADDWKCLYCNCKPLWDVRAVCAVITLELKRRKHKKCPTRRGDCVLDDDCSRSEDSNSDFESKKPINRRRFRSAHLKSNANKINPTLQKREGISDHNSSDSPDSLETTQNFTVDNKDSDAKGSYVKSVPHPKSLLERNGAGPSKGERKQCEDLASSADESFDCEKTQVSNSKLHNGVTKVKSKSLRRLNNGSSSRPINQHQNTRHSTPKHSRISESAKTSKNLANNSDSEASHESAKDFVRVKRKNLKTQGEIFSNKDGKLNNSKTERRSLKTKSGIVMIDRRTLVSFLESKDEKLKDVDHSSIDPKTNETGKNIRRSKLDILKSDEDSDSFNSHRRPHKKDRARKTRSSNKVTDSKEKDHREGVQNPRTSAEIVTLSAVDGVSGQVCRTKGWPTQTSSSHAQNNRHWDKKKTLIKLSYAKFASSIDSVTEEQGALLRRHVDNLIDEIKLLGKGLSIGAKKIADKHLANNVTSVAAVSKTVQKYELLMIRCQKTLGTIEKGFVESYEDWCRKCELKSMFSNMENVDVSAGNEVEPTIEEETWDNTEKNTRISRACRVKRDADNSVECSDASKDDRNFQAYNHAHNLSGPTLNTDDDHSDDQQKSVVNCKDLGYSGNPEKMNTSIQQPASKDSDEDSRNAMCDEMSGYDSNVISSEDESRRQVNKANELVNKKNRLQSPLSNTSEQQSIEWNSKECDDANPENLKKIRAKSLESDEVIENLTDTPENHEQDSQEKFTNCAREKNSEKLPRPESCNRNTQQLNMSAEGIFDGNTANDSNLNEESMNPSNIDRPVRSYSESTENASVVEKAAIPGTKVTDKVGRSSLGDKRSGKSDAKLDVWSPTSANEWSSGHTSKHEIKLEARVHDSSTDASDNVDEVSDCDTELIFSSSTSDNSTIDLAARHISRRADPEVGAEELEGTKHISASEIRTDAEMLLSINSNCNNNTVILSKDMLLSPETIARRHEGDINSEDECHNSKTPKEHQKFKKVIETNAGALSSNDDENNSKRDAVAAEEYGEDGETEKARTTVFDYDSEEAIKKKILESDSDLSDDNTEMSPKLDAGVAEENEEDEPEKARATAFDYDSQEVISKNFPESDTDLSDDSTRMYSGHDRFQLRMDSNSEESEKASVPADSDTAVITSDELDEGDEPHDFELRGDNCDTNSNSPRFVEIDVSDLNNLAKSRLLSSSNSSNSASDVSQPASPQKNDQVTSSPFDDNESTNLINSKVKRKKFTLEKSNYYKTDKKLQMTCKVLVRRLDESVLVPFRQSLSESRQHQERENFKSLVDLNNIKKRKRDTRESNQSGSSSEASSSQSSTDQTKKKKSKQAQEKEETLLDHLEKMKNGENYCNLSADECDENNETLKTIVSEENAEEEFSTDANKLAKDLLIQSSDSENEEQTSPGNAEEHEQDKTSKPEKRNEQTEGKNVSNEEAVDSGSNHENGSNAQEDNDKALNVKTNVDLKKSEDSDNHTTRDIKRLKEKLGKRNWRLTDSDSSSEEKKWQKSQLTKEDKKGDTEKEEDGLKRKKNVKRRVLGSDSDSVILSDLSDDSTKIIDQKNSSSDSDDSQLFKSLRKKRRKKRSAGQKSETDSESEEDKKPAKQKRKRIKKMDSDSDSENNTLANSQDTPGKLHRKNIRKVLKDKQVADVTKIAGKEEEERLKRIAERQKLYNEMYELKLANEAKVDKLILDFEEETKKELISVHEDLVKRLKPHQAQGIKFMWDACFESLERTKSTQGSGCIVAHCMGLGKTFQVVTLAHTLLTHAETGIKTIMVICPLSTVLNWVNEFKKWLSDINNDEDVEVFEMTKMKKNFERKYQLEKWHRTGGVMVLGYEMFRLLSNQTGKKMRKNQHEAILKCLVDPGPDLIVCDEGHLLKNEDTALSKAMRRVKTLRRIVLTGTPLQNNLVEYHCMVQFVKPNLLGTKKEFLNRFVNPITNGQFDDSTEYDVKLMKKRAHVLHKMLEGSVQRFDYSVLTPFLPPKQEYVITVRLADIQIKLYQHYLDNFSRKKVGGGTSLFADFQALQRIWTHPIVLRMNAEKMEKLNEKKRMDASDSEGSLRDFLDDGSDEKSTSSSDSDILSAHGSSDDRTNKPKRATRANPIVLDTLKQEEEEPPQAGEWWHQFVEPEHFEDLRISSKLVLLFAILKESEQIGDKVLVFSQSLYALSLIEEFLNKIDDETQRQTCSELIDGHSGSWSLGLDYFRLDGQTAPENRNHYCRIFNNPKNGRARLFLISTRAGGLGINLTAANRVIIFDASWNPSHDVQSIFRIYRFGQKKPCYVYRFLAQGTMEEKIYNRQVTKLSLSCRVVDEQQIERHYSNHDLAELYQFEPNTSKEKPTLNLPKDRLLAEILRKYEDRIETFHEHDSLLENKAEEELDEEERKEAWKEYEDERTGRKMYMNNAQNQNMAMQQYNEMLNMSQVDIASRASLSGINIETLQSLIRKDYPNYTPQQQTMMTSRAILDMYAYMENEAVRQQRMAATQSYNYPTVSNLGTTSFIDKNQMPAVQRQYALQQQQQQLQQFKMQRDSQANYAKRYGNVRGPALTATATRPPQQIVNLQVDDNDVIEIPTSPSTASPTPSSSVQPPPASSAAPAENSKRQEE